VNKISRVGVVGLVLVLSIILDQVTKAIAQKTLESKSPISLLSGFIRLEYVENSGGFLGLGANWPNAVRLTVLVIIAALIITVLFTFTLRSRLLTASQLVGMSLIVAGGFGNVVDRMFRQGKVIDFVSIGLPSLRTGVFNLADLMVLLGAVVLILTTPTEIDSDAVDDRYHDANKRIRI